MDGLLVLLALAVLAVPVAVFYLLFAHFGIKARLRAIEARVDQMAAELRGHAPTEPDSRPIAQEAPPDRETSVEGHWPEMAAPAPPSEPPVVEDLPESLETPPDQQQESPIPKAVVFRRDRMAEAATWLKTNWFLAIAALSLALAGVFLVQYGIENGLLTPFWRVAGAVALGLD
jgi:uncharacterized membrane protein